MFLATLAFGACQCLEETYPGLHAPAFRDGGEAEPVARERVATTIEVRVAFRDGGVAWCSIHDLVPRIAGKLRGNVVGELVDIGIREQPGALRAWLRNQVIEQFPARAPARIELIRRPSADGESVEVLLAGDVEPAT